MTNAVACPDPETIAAYLDRRLGPAERARVEEHLADCEECRTLLSETCLFLEADAVAKPAVPARSSRRPWIWSLAAAAAVLLALTPLVLQRMRPTPESALEELDRALAGKRYVESRLSGFEYGAFVSATRGPSTPLEDLPLSAVAAAGRVEELTGASDTPESLASLGASQLAIGRVDKAVESLEDAARIAPKDARIQSDLAAAYLARFRAGDYPEDPAKAVEAAATAVALDPQSRAAGFNRALALEALPLRGEALRAWEAYLALDPSSAWANEARAHIEELKRPLPPPPPSPSAMLDELESQVFPAWGRAVLASRDTEALDALERARSLAAEIQELDDDRLALDTLASIDASAPAPARLASLARAHVFVGDGRKAYLDGRFTEADGAFANAYALLRDGHSPYADWVLMRRSTSRFQVGDTPGAWAVLVSMAEGSGGDSPTLRARTQRMRGFIRGRSGDLAVALSHYRSAQAALARDARGDDAIALSFLVGETLDLLGDRPEAWAELRSGLNRLPFVRNTRQRQARFFETAGYALRQHRPRTALGLLDELVHDREALPGRTLAEALLHRARVLDGLGEEGLAFEALRQAADRIDVAESLGPLPRLRAELLAARGELALRREPESAIASLSEGLLYFEADRAGWRLAGLHLARGKARVALGQLSDGESDFSKGAEIIEAQRTPLESESMRISFFALAGDLFEAQLKLALDRGLAASATLAIAERGRARALRDLLQPVGREVGLDELRVRLPDRTILLVFAALDDRLVLWRVDRRACVAWSEPLPREELSALVAGLRRDLRRGRSQPPASFKLFDLLVRRALADGQWDTLVVVPDGCLNFVPFAALIDSQTLEYLVQRVAVVLTPSASLLASGSTEPFTGRGSSLVVSAAGPTKQREAPLRFADPEAHAVAALYRPVTLLSGASATKAAFLSSAQTSETVHFVGHAIADDDSPFLSRLLFSPREGSPGSENLFADEIARTRFPSTRLVILSACASGAGRDFKGEGVVSLARPFLGAGVPTVVASLWDVDDRLANHELRSFHEHLRAGQKPAQALRSAQLSMLAAPDPAVHRPWSWAAFSVFSTSL